MKLLSFSGGLLMGLSASVLFELHQAAMVPYERGDIVAGLLRREIDQIEACTSRQDAINKIHFLTTQFPKEISWGEMLPPIIEEDSVTFRICRPHFGNVSKVIQGTAKLPREEHD